VYFIPYNYHLIPYLDEINPMGGGKLYIETISTWSNIMRYTSLCTLYPFKDVGIIECDCHDSL